MKKILTAGLLGITLCTSAFSQVGKVGINTTTPAAMLHVMDSSVLFSGIYPLPSNPVPPPFSGAGTRLMWYPDKAALRAGTVTGTEWDETNIGRYSMATGRNTVAKGDYSAAMGWLSEATGISSVAMGFRSIAQGTTSMAFGSDAKSLGTYAISLGHDLIANGYSGTVVGTYNDTLGIPEMFLNPTSPLFVVGNGDNDTTRRNALVVRKDGNVGIGTSIPAARLHVEEKSVLFRAPATLPGTPGAPPVSGAGNRMMWYADKAAFRTGGVFGTQWNKDSIGTYSFACGFEVKAKGSGSVAGGYYNESNGFGSVALGKSNKALGETSLALGWSNTASDWGYNAAIGNSNTVTQNGVAIGGYNTSSALNAIAIGNNCLASASSALAMGSNTVASGINATTIGYVSRASGDETFATGYETRSKGQAASSFGYKTISNGFACLTTGIHNDSLVAPKDAYSFLETDPLFIIGNGSSVVPSNAFVVRKDGNIGLGNINPSYRLHIANNQNNDGGWSKGIVIENTSAYATAGEAGIAWKNASLAASKRWIAGINQQSPGLAFNYGSTLAAGTTFLVIDTTGNVGIGNTSPQVPLHVNGGTDAGLGNTTGYLVIGDVAGANIVMDNNEILSRNNGATTNLRLQLDGGNVSIGNVSPSFNLHLNLDSAAKPSTNTWTVPSDARLKTNVHAYTDGLARLMEIHPVWYTYSGKAGLPEDTSVGVIAQELQQVAPYMVGEWKATDESGSTSTYLSVNNGAMTYMLINAVKEQQAIITSQQERIDALEKEMQEIRSLLQGVTQK